MVQNTKELYEKMLTTPDLCGKFELVDKTIFWIFLMDTIFKYQSNHLQHS